jgi:hypothetical protein
MNFVSHDQFSGESHMVERALFSIWSSSLKESDDMSHVIKSFDLNKMSKRVENKKTKKMKALVKRFLVVIYINLNKISGLLFSKFN